MVVGVPWRKNDDDPFVDGSRKGDEETWKQVRSGADESAHHARGAGHFAISAGHFATVSQMTLHHLHSGRDSSMRRRWRWHLRRAVASVTKTETEENVDGLQRGQSHSIQLGENDLIWRVSLVDFDVAGEPLHLNMFRFDEAATTTINTGLNVENVDRKNLSFNAGYGGES